MKSTVLNFPSRITLLKPQVFKNMQVIPMALDKVGELEYLTLKTGIETGQVEVTEVDEGGSVPNLMVVNQSTLPVLLMDGEELAGAKQNRIVNSTIKRETIFLHRF